MEYGISLNPKKCQFGVTEGKLLGHIVFREGVRIDLERVMEIDKIPLPKNVKAIQFFFGKINFIRRFITNFVEITRPISRMLKKGSKVEWNEEALKAFADIKKTIKEAPVLKNPNYNKPMQIFSFASFHTIAAML